MSELPYLEVTMTAYGAALKAPMGWNFLERLPEGARLVVQFAEDRTPQPVTPAGGEVVLTGWTKADGKTLWMEHDGLPVFNEGKHDDLGTNKAIHLYTHPPVADAALVNFILSRDLYALLTDIQNGIDSPATCGMANRLIIRLDKLRDSALNQRGVARTSAEAK